MLATLIGTINELRFEVRNFKEEIPGKKYRWSCEVCGDSVKDRRKARFGVKIESEGGVVNCFNCGYSNSLISYLKHFHPHQYEKLSLERLKETQANPLFDVNSVISQNISDNALKSIFTPSLIQRFTNKLNEQSLTRLREAYNK